MSETDHPKSWYPVALSSEVVNKPHAVHVFGKDFVLFRDAAGRIAAIERRCSHMGADLARGKIVGDAIQCPLHAWKFHSDGSCGYLKAETQAINGDLASLATEEVGGIIFVWPGPKPDWSFPDLHEVLQMSAARPRAEFLDCPMLVIGLNGFDIWHYGMVHHRKVRPGARVFSDVPHHLGLEFSADVLPVKVSDKMLIKLGFRELNVKLDYWGGNLIFVRNQSSGYLAMLALRPEGEDACRLYISVLAEMKEQVFSRIAQGVMLEVFRFVAWNFLQSDMPVVAGMKPREGVLIPGKDDIAQEFWHWWRALPRLSGDTN